MKKVKGLSEKELRQIYKNTPWVRNDIKSLIDGQVKDLGNDAYANFNEQDRENYFVDEVTQSIGIYDNNMVSDGVLLTLKESGAK